MLTIAQLHKGQTIIHEQELYLVVDATHSKVAQSRAVMRVKIKNLRNNKIIEVAFSGNDKIAEADLQYLQAQYLYHDQGGAHFMDENYEQFSLNDELLGRAGDFLREGANVDLAIWNNRPLYIKLPPKVELKVAEAAPAVRGDTANNASKLVKMETGLEVLAPLFIKAGDILRINTESGEYVERA